MERSTLPPVEDEFTRALLRSAESDEPSKLAYAKAAAELGLGLGVGLSVSASLPVPAALATSAAALSSAARWSTSTAARLVALGVSGALLVGGAAYLVHRPSAAARAKVAHATSSRAPRAQVQHSPAPVYVPTPDAAAPRSAALHASPDAAAQPLLPAQFGATSAPVETSTPDASRRRAKSSSGSSASRRLAHDTNASAHGAPGFSLAEQVQSLDRARVALTSGDASSALREIAYYRGTWPKGVFLTEASVLEIEALAARGERSLAGLRAAAFVASHPDSPQADRLRALIPADQP